MGECTSSGPERLGLRDPPPPASPLCLSSPPSSLRVSSSPSACHRGRAVPPTFTGNRLLRSFPGFPLGSLHCIRSQIRASTSASQQGLGWDTSSQACPWQVQLTVQRTAPIPIPARPALAPTRRPVQPGAQKPSVQVVQRGSRANILPFPRKIPHLPNVSFPVKISLQPVIVGFPGALCASRSTDAVLLRGSVEVAFLLDQAGVGKLPWSRAREETL